MSRLLRRFSGFLLTAITLALACGPAPLEVPEDDDDDDDVNGGTGASGGTPPQGGTGAGALGGTGFSGSGFGGTGFGGTAGSFGGAGQAGTPSGGFAGVSTAGVSGTGLGGAGAGGAGVAGTPTAGTGAAGAPPVACDATWAVGADGFVRSPSLGGVCWHGYAFTFAGPAGSSTVMPASFSTCGTPCMVCASGSVAATADYSGTGLVGFNINQAVGGAAMTVTPTGTGLTINYTNTGGSELRVQILGPSGDTVATDRWCAPLTATSGPVTIPYTSFNTTCWDNMGAAYMKQPIKAVQLIVPGSNTAAVSFNMCLTDARDS